MTDHRVTWILSRTQNARFEEHCQQSEARAILDFWRGRDAEGNHVYQVERWPWTGEQDGLAEHLLPFLRTCPQASFRLILIRDVPWLQMNESGAHAGLAAYVAVRLPTHLERVRDSAAEVEQALAKESSRVPRPRNESLAGLTVGSILHTLGLSGASEDVRNAVAGALLGVACPPGRFVMGSPPEVPGSDWRERQHEAALTRAFAIGQYPVPQALWQAVMGSNPAHFTFPARPVEQVSWLDALDFCNALSARLGLEAPYTREERVEEYVDDCGIRQEEVEICYFCEFDCSRFRLPSETEWEYACRAETASAAADVPYNERSSIEPVREEVAWYVQNSFGETHMVGQKQPNEWAIYDMIGNVREWCWDAFQPYRGATVDSVGPALPTAMDRVVRGGGWAFVAKACRAGARGIARIQTRENTTGLRLARTLR